MVEVGRAPKRWIVHALAYAVLAGLAFLGVAALVRPGAPTFRRSTIVAGAAIGALPALLGVVMGSLLAPLFAVAGGLYGAFVGVRVADLRRS